MGKIFDAKMLREFALRMGIKNPDVQPIEVNVLEEGDKISLEKYVGGVQDEDGITTGGKWVEMFGTYHPYNEVCGEVRTVMGIRICSLEAEPEINYYPAKNVKLI
jgi:hypothetical protein